jgi:hypothetical protein
MEGVINKNNRELWQTAHTAFWGEWGSAALLESDQPRPACLSSCTNSTLMPWAVSGWGRISLNWTTHSLMTWQSVLFWSEQSHLMAGLNAGLSSSGVSSVAAPLQGLPLIFHDAGALSPSLLRIVFTAAAAKKPSEKIRLRSVEPWRGVQSRAYAPSTGSVCGWAWADALQERHRSSSKNSSTNSLSFILVSHSHPSPLRAQLSPSSRPKQVVEMDKSTTAMEFWKALNDAAKRWALVNWSELLISMNMCRAKCGLEKKNPASDGNSIYG